MLHFRLAIRGTIVRSCGGVCSVLGQARSFTTIYRVFAFVPKINTNAIDFVGRKTQQKLPVVLLTQAGKYYFVNQLTNFLLYMFILYEYVKMQKKTTNTVIYIFIIIETIFCELIVIKIRHIFSSFCERFLLFSSLKFNLRKYQSVLLYSKNRFSRLQMLDILEENNRTADLTKE